MRRIIKVVKTKAARARNPAQIRKDLVDIEKEAQKRKDSLKALPIKLDLETKGNKMAVKLEFTKDLPENRKKRIEIAVDKVVDEIMKLAEKRRELRDELRDMDYIR